MNTNSPLTPYGEALEKIINLQDSLIKETKEALALMYENKALKNMLSYEQEHNEMLEAELKAMREQLNANQV